MKQINWAEMPIGVIFCTHFEDKSGAFLYFDFLSKNPTLLIKGQPYSFRKAAIKLAPPDQQPWLYYEHGVTKVPVWAVVEYRVESFDILEYAYDFFNIVKIPPSLHKGAPRAYRILGIKEGYTL